MQSDGNGSDLGQRFWLRVDQSAGSDACWPWAGYCNTNGYGNVRILGRRASTHRLAYELSHGSIPTGLFVLHTCDNPPCCNPTHLYTGTAADNSRDAMSRNRTAKGERNGYSKLSNADISEIGRLYDAGKTQVEIAKQFGVRQSAIARHTNGRGKGWNFRGTNNPGSKITPDVVREIRQRRESGEKLQSIAGSVGLSVPRVSEIANRKGWRQVE